MTRETQGTFRHLRPALVLAGLVASLGFAGAAHADVCPYNVCGHVLNQSGRAMQVTGDTEQSHQQQVACTLDGQNGDSRSCLRDVDTFTFTDTPFRVCMGRFCFPPEHVFRPNQPYQIHGEDVICDHPQGHYVRCRLFAKVF